MKLALFGINVGPCADPGVGLRVAQAAEAAGLESVWTGEHVVLPDPQAPPSPVPPDTKFLDPAVALAYIAAGTRTIRLGTGIIILPQRNPLVLAKEMASLDVVSGGRLMFGIGVGYLKPEFDALGVSFENKGARSIDYLRAMLALWTEVKPAYAGRFVSFSGIQSLPQPLQKPHPPIVFGGNTPEAFRRAVRWANGWYGFAMNHEVTAHCLTGLRAAADQIERPAHLGPLEISITPAVKLDADAVKRYADLGVHRLIVTGRATNEMEVLRMVEAIAALPTR